MTSSLLGGDLSNESPFRWLVTLDCLLAGDPPRKTLLRSWDVVARDTPLEQLGMARVWQASSRYGVVFEMVLFGTSEYAEALERRLERSGTNAVRWVSAYEDRRHLQSALAYRPDVQAVVDEQDKYMQWGGRGIALTDLN